MHRRANGFKRVLACLIDVIPIWLISLVIYQAYTGESPMSMDPYDALTPGRLIAKNACILVWIIYGTIAECTPMRGTFGKKVMGLEVLGPHHRPLRFRRALRRNLGKIVSVIPCYLGFIAAFFSNTSSAWHDSMARCGVYERR